MDRKLVDQMDQSEALMESQINIEAVYRKLKVEHIFMQGRLDETQEQFTHAMKNYDTLNKQYKELQSQFQQQELVMRQRLMTQ